MSENTEIPLINVRKVFYDKNPGLARWIPGFLYKFFERLIHQDDMNRVLINTRGSVGADFIVKCFNEIGVNVQSKNSEFLPKTGPVIVASNHPLGGLDGMGLILEVYKMRQDVKFLVNDILINVKPLKVFFEGVNKHGANAKGALLSMENLFASDNAVLIFPAGLVSRKQKGRIFDLPWQKSFITKSIRYNTDIIPVFIEGENSRRFYNIANLRKRLKIKSNLEMLLLPSEMFRQKRKTVTIHFGKPISAELVKSLNDHRRVADAMRHFVYLLKDNPEADFESFYRGFSPR